MNKVTVNFEDFLFYVGVARTGKTYRSVIDAGEGAKSKEFKTFKAAVKDLRDMLNACIKGAGGEKKDE